MIWCVTFSKTKPNKKSENKKQRPLHLNCSLNTAIPLNRTVAIFLKDISTCSTHFTCFAGLCRARVLFLNNSQSRMPHRGDTFKKKKTALLLSLLFKIYHSVFDRTAPVLLKDIIFKTGFFQLSSTRGFYSVAHAALNEPRWYLKEKTAMLLS